MRSSALIGRAKIARSIRVARANSTRSSTLPSLGKPSTVSGDRSSVAVVEHAEQSNFSRIGLGEVAQQAGGRFAAADDHRASLETPRSGQRAHDLRQKHALGRQFDESQSKPTGDPDPGHGAVGLQEKHRGERDEKNRAPAAGHAEQLPDRTPERRDRIALQCLKDENRQRRNAHAREIVDRPHGSVVHHVQVKERQSGQQQHCKFNSAHRADHDHAGVGGPRGLGGELVEKRGMGTGRALPRRLAGVDRSQLIGGEKGHWRSHIGDLTVATTAAGRARRFDSASR